MALFNPDWTPLLGHNESTPPGYESKDSMLNSNSWFTCHRNLNPFFEADDSIKIACMVRDSSFAWKESLSRKTIIWYEVDVYHIRWICLLRTMFVNHPRCSCPNRHMKMKNIIQMFRFLHYFLAPWKVESTFHVITKRR